MLLLLVRNADIPRMSKCRRILESFSISVLVVAQYFVPKKVFAASIVRMQINTVHQSRENSLTERMLTLHKQSTVVRSPLDKEQVGREIESTDKAINRLVYELSRKGVIYGLIKIVESWFVGMYTQRGHKLRFFKGGKPQFMTVGII
jgi:hypothetical protein